MVNPLKRLCEGLLTWAFFYYLDENFVCSQIIVIFAA